MLRNPAGKGVTGQGLHSYQPGARRRWGKGGGGHRPRRIGEDPGRWGCVMGQKGHGEAALASALRVGLNEFVFCRDSLDSGSNKQQALFDQKRRR